MKKLINNFLNHWRKVCGTIGVILIFLMPASRDVLGQIINLASIDGIGGNQKQSPALGERNNPGNSDSRATNAPSSQPPVSPMGNSGNSNGHTGRCRHRPKHTCRHNPRHR